MGYIKGIGVKVEIAATYGTAKTVSAITNAKPGVATSTAHALANGAAGYLSTMAGMVELEGQPVRVANQTSNSFELETIDTTLMSSFTGTCQFVPVATWLTLAPATSYTVGGGEGATIDETTLLDTIEQQTRGLISAQTIAFGMRAEDIPSASVRVMRDAALAGTFVLGRITLRNGSQRLFRAIPNLAGEDVQQGQGGTSSLSMPVKGRVLFLD